MTDDSDKLITVSKLRDNINNVLSTNSLFKNFAIKCSVKKVSVYSHAIYLSICDLGKGSNTSEINALIYSNNYSNTINVGDSIIVHGSLSVKKDMQVVIHSYTFVDKEISNYSLILDRLKKDNILSMEKKKIPSIIRNIAIISSNNAAGLKDCLNILKGIALTTIDIYSVFLQGKTMERDVVNAIESCNEAGLYDVILLIRGGGSKGDLEWFDNYNIARSIKFSILPVICGIGHEIDHVIVDDVADVSCTTPTQTAYFINEMVTKRNNYVDCCNNLYLKKVKHLCDIYTQCSKNIMFSDKILSKDRSMKLMELNNTYDCGCRGFTELYHAINEHIQKHDMRLQQSLLSCVSEYSKHISKIGRVIALINEKILLMDRQNMVLSSKYKSLSNTILNKVEYVKNVVLVSIDKKIVTASAIKIYDNNESRYIHSKSEMKQAIKNNHKLLICFIDGNCSVQL
jgi:exodeoxyribonuclease VII large subunit